MISFEYYNPAKIVFGENSEQKLTELLKANEVHSLLLVYSGEFIKELGIYKVIEDAVKDLGIKFISNNYIWLHTSQSIFKSKMLACATYYVAKRANI